MLGVAKNENDSCGIQNLIVKKTKSYLLMAPTRRENNDPSIQRENLGLQLGAR